MRPTTRVAVARSRTSVAGSKEREVAAADRERGRREGGRGVARNENADTHTEAADLAGNADLGRTVKVVASMACIAREEATRCQSGMLPRMEFAKKTKAMGFTSSLMFAAFFSHTVKNVHLDHFFSSNAFLKFNPKCGIFTTSLVPRTESV